MDTTIQEYFKEIEEHSIIAEANDIIQIKIAEQRQDGPYRTPITIFDSCSPMELETIGKAMEIELRNSLRATGVSEKALPASAYPAPALNPPQYMTLDTWAETINLFYPSQSLFRIMEKLSRFIVSYDGEFYMRSGCVYEPISEDRLRQGIFSYLLPQLASGKVKTSAISEVVRLLRDNPAIVRTQKSDDGSYVYFLNGKYNIETGAFELPRIDEFFTCYIPINYTTENTGCPSFFRFVSDIAGGKSELVDRVLEMIGYLLVPDNHAKKFFLLMGPGNSGKSVLGNLIASLFNPDSIANLPIQRFQDKHSTSILRDKYINISMDLPKTAIHKDAVGTIKMVTGDDAITVEPKYKNAASMRPTCRLLFGSNYPLQVRDPDPAFASRMVLIPFDRPIPAEQQDKTLLDRLKAESVGIVMASLQAYKRLRAQNYVFSGERFVQAVPSGIGGTDMLQNYLRECCHFSPESYCFTADLFHAYNEYCVQHGAAPEYDMVVFSRNLATACQGRITRKKKRLYGENRNGYEGISLLGHQSQTQGGEEDE